MKKLLAIILCTLSVSAIADDAYWVYVHGNSTESTFVNTKSIRVQAEHIAAQIMMDYARPLTAEGMAEPVKSQIFQYLIDCRERKYGFTHVAAYSENMARGRLLFNLPVARNVLAVTPGSFGEMQVDFVCRHLAMTTGLNRNSLSPQFPQSASESNRAWSLIVRHASFNVFVDSRSIKNPGKGMASAWVLAEYPGPQIHPGTGEAYRSITSLEIYDCNGIRFAYTEAVFHEGSMGTGKVISHAKDLPVDFSALMRESVGEMRLRQICSATGIYPQPEFRNSEKIIPKITPPTRPKPPEIRRPDTFTPLSPHPPVPQQNLPNGAH